MDAIRKKPDTWGRKSIAPYYNQQSAEQVKPYVDRMIESGQDILFKYSECCGPEEKIMSKQTLYNKINQSVRFLVDYDQTGIYSKWRTQIKCERRAGLGVIIYFIPGFTGEPIFKGENVVPASDKPKWKAQLDEWISSNEKKPFKLEGLVLTDIEVSQLKAELDGLSNVVHSISNTCVKVLKVMA